MPDELEGTTTWSLDDVSDEALVARISKLPQFAHIFAPPPASPPSPAGGASSEKESIAQAIKTALSEVMAKSAPTTPSPPSAPAVVERVVEKVHSWFIDE